jgi:type II secretory pathway component GspD/PulD (secretin)
MTRRISALLPLAVLLVSLTPISARTSVLPVQPAVFNLQTISAAHAAEVLRRLYPHVRITVDARANAVVVVAPAPDIDAMRQIVTGIDVKNPTAPTIDTLQLHAIKASEAMDRLRALFPHARFRTAPHQTLIVQATPADMAMIHTIVSTLDSAPATPSPKPEYPAEAVRVTQRSARDVARAVARTVPDVRVAVSGSSVLLSGPSDEVSHAKALISQIDLPQMNMTYTEVYRLRFVDATSVADLLHRSFSGIAIQVDKDLNAITVLATSSIQQRIADAVAQLDAAPSDSGASPGAPGSSVTTSYGPGGTQSEVLTLRAAVPGLNGGPSTSANDIAQTVQQALSNAAPDLKVTVPPNSTQLVLTGSPYSIKIAKDLIDQLDIPPQIVALDTEVLEVDAGVSKQLGLKFATAALSSQFTEVSPSTPTDGGTPPPLMRLQPISRTALSLQAELDFLITNHQARILEDPRLTTISGRTASLRAGETINILTTTGGGTGTVATTQVQSFQTGVTLDITPVINANNYISVSLHPSVNTFAGSNGGVPQIQTRDATTTVGLQDGQTLVIGGLIEDDMTHDAQKIPFLGDLPLIGKLFRDTSVQYSRNELIVTVTPHIVAVGDAMGNPFNTGLPAIPTPQPLPTLAPGTHLPPPHKKIPTPEPAPEPSPIDVATPAPLNATTPSPARATPRTQQPTPRPAAAPSATPQPLPTAFNQTNVYTYGQAPQNNYADPQAPPQIFYVQVQPSVVRNGQSMTISAITTTNVARLTFGVSAMNTQVSLSKIGPGQWQSTFNFSNAGLPGQQGNVQMTLNAYTNLGAVASVPIPLSLVQ